METVISVPSVWKKIWLFLYSVNRQWGINQWKPVIYFFNKKYVNNIMFISGKFECLESLLSSLEILSECDDKKGIEGVKIG